MSYAGDDYEGDDWKEGHPLIATGIAVAILLVGGYFALPYIPPSSFLTVVAASLVISGVIWAIAHFVTMRYSPAGWTVASFVVLLLVTAGIGFQATERLKGRVKIDMQTLVDLKVDAEGLVVVPKDAEQRGPFSKLMVEFIRVINEDQRMLDAESKAIGFDTMADASAVERNPVLLRNCGRIGPLKIKTHEALERRRAAMATMIKGIDDMDYPEEFKEGARQGAVGGRNDGMLQRVDEIQGRLFDAAAGACTVLARRRWKAQGDMFMFTHQGDLDAFARYSEQQNRAFSELTMIDQANQARLRGFQTGLRQELRRMR